MDDKDLKNIIQQIEENQKSRIMMDEFNCRKGSIEYKFTEFIVIYLGNNGGEGRIDQLTLTINGLNYSYTQFIEYQKATDNYYVEIVKKKKKYIKLKLTDVGIGKYNQYFDNTLETKKATTLERFIIAIIHSWKYSISVLKNIFGCIKNNFIKTLTVIVLILSILTFIGIPDYTKIKTLIKNSNTKESIEQNNVVNKVEEKPSQQTINQ